MIIEQDQINSMTFTQLTQALKADNPNFDRQQDHRLKIRGTPGGQLDMVQEKAGLLGGGSKDQQRAASVVLGSLINELGPQKAMDAFNAAGLDVNNTKFKVSDLAKIQEGIGQQISQKWSNEAPQLSSQQEHEQFIQDGVMGVMGADAKWNMASQGAGMTLLGNGVVVKLDNTSNVRCGEEMSKLMTRVLNNAAGETPFEAPKFAGVHGLSTDAQEVVAIKQMLDDQKQISPGKMTKINDNLALLNNEETLENQALAKMDMVPGKMINELSTAEKVALFKSPQFAQDIGKAAVLCPMFGLNDHVAPSTDGSVNFGVGTSNLSNLMLNQETGKLAIIDYATLESDGRMGVTNPDKAIGFIKDYVANASQDATALDNAAKRACADGTNSSYETPLCGTMSKFMQPGGENFFSDSEQAAFDDLSEADKVDFAKNMMRGVVDGLQYVNQNQQVFEQAYAQTVGVAVNGAAPAGQHFVKPEEMNAIKGIVADAPNLQQQMDQAGVPKAAQNVAPKNLQPVINAVDNLSQPPLQATLIPDPNANDISGYSTDDDLQGVDAIKPSSKLAEEEMDMDDPDDLDEDVDVDVKVDQKADLDAGDSEIKNAEDELDVDGLDAADDLDEGVAVNQKGFQSVKDSLNAPQAAKAAGPAADNALRNTFKRQGTDSAAIQAFAAGQKGPGKSAG
jgi:hypothetical protein